MPKIDKVRSEAREWAKKGRHRAARATVPVWFLGALDGSETKYPTHYEAHESQLAVRAAGELVVVTRAGDGFPWEWFWAILAGPIVVTYLLVIAWSVPDIVRRSRDAFGKR